MQTGIPKSGRSGCNRSVSTHCPGVKSFQNLCAQLLHLLEQAARGCGLDSLRLGCYAANLPGAAFWKKQGFAVVEERTLQETSGEHLLLVMEKSI